MDSKARTGLIEKYKKAKNRLVLLDYDGTLVNFSPLPETAIISDHLFEILINLIRIPQTDVFIITGRAQQDIDKLLDHLSIDIIAEHGAMIKEDGVWKDQIPENGLWKRRIIPLLEHMTLRCTESYIEEKKFSVTWHYRNAKPESGYKHSRELIRLLKDIIDPLKLKILDGNKVVEVMQDETGKGKAVKELLDHNSYDFILSIGDDATDEEMFEYFLYNTNAFTIKVGNGKTLARYKLASINDVVTLLKHLSE